MALTPYYTDARGVLYHGDCQDVMRALDVESVDAIVTDPPYGLAFMGKEWDHGVPGVPFWTEALRVAKPGAHLLSFGGTRTYHRLTCAIEDAGWEIRDCVMWIYGSGFPKSLDVSKAIDKAAGAEREVVGPDPNWRSSVHSDNTYDGGQTRPQFITAPATDAAKQWQGWGTALKPAYEPILIARKPLIGTVAQNVLAHGTGAINVDGCRITTPDDTSRGPRGIGGQCYAQDSWTKNPANHRSSDAHPSGRWPANVIHDGSEEVVGLFPQAPGMPQTTRRQGSSPKGYGIGIAPDGADASPGYGDSGSAARFFYTAKASRADRGEGNTHPTVKPLSLMRYLVRLVTQPGGTVLDPFCGSGTILEAAWTEGAHTIGIELDEAYCGIAAERCRQGALTEMFR
jgi:site-specific DNA-methyltransferase (adenine-specific)